LIFRLVNSPIPLIISSFVEPTSTSELKNLAKKRKSVLEAQQRERLKQQKGRDPDIDKSLDEIEQFLDELSNEVERGFIYSMYVAIEAWSNEQLIQTHKDFQDLTNTMGLTYNIYSYGQENGFKSMYPFDDDKVGQNRILQTTSTAYLLPFVSKEFVDVNGVFVGVNMTNNSLVYLDPFACRNHNINIFGVSGGGKSVTAQVLASRMYTRGAQIIIIDPEGEYVDFTHRLQGEVISFSRSNGINPFYIANEEEEAIQDHIGVLKTFFKYFIPANKYDDAILDQKLMTFYFKQKTHTFAEFMKLMKGTSMFDYLNVLHEGSMRGIFNSKKKLNLNQLLYQIGQVKIMNE
jgi:type IV secretory pathway VirB4 component